MKNAMPAWSFLNPMRRLTKPAVLIFLLIFLPICPAWMTTAAATSLVYKNYVVHYDRGWDILCERYVVQKNDWVLKILRQKGEIANQDFREFAGIFERLNPHIRDIDLIRPGQAIDIPLRKLEQGTLPGQASGIVTIPFVTLSKVADVILQHAESYTVQMGDTVSKLLADQYGKYGSQSYNEGVKLFEAANPQIKDLNLIYAGQKINLPESSIRDQSWYASLYDEQGNLRKTVKQNNAPVADGKPAAQTAIAPLNAIARQDRPAAKPKLGSLVQAAAAVGGSIKNKGTFFLTRPGTEDFEVDMSRHPMLELRDGPRLFFSTAGKLMETAAQEVTRQWPDVKVVTYDEQSSTEEIISTIFSALQQNEPGRQEKAEVTFADGTVRVLVRSKWIKTQSDQRHLCIAPIDDTSEQTPESMRRYLEQNGIILKEILPTGDTAVTKSGDGQRHAVKNILALAPTGQKDFVQSLARALGFSYTPNVGISFPYAGVQITAFSNLLSAGSGREVLVDYGDLHGDALGAIRDSGPQVIQVTPDDRYGAIVLRLFKTMGLEFAENPVFLAAARPPEFNTEISISGILYSKDPDKRILLTSAEIHPAVTDLLSSQGIDMVVWP